MPRRFAWILWLAALPMLGILAYNLDPLDLFTKRRPAIEDVVGIWTLDDSGVKTAGSGSRAVAPTLVLRRDGTFVARELPAWWDFAGRGIVRRDKVETVWKLVSREGKWSLGTSQERWVIKLHFSMESDRPQGFTAIANLCGRRPPYCLCVVVGDPDQGRWLIFRRASPTRSRDRDSGTTRARRLSRASQAPWLIRRVGESSRCLS